MEGRSGPSYTSYLGGGSGGRRQNRNVQTAIGSGSAQATASVVIGAIAATHPLIAMLYAAYQVSQYVAPIAKVGIEEKLKSGDTDKALDKMGREAVHQGMELLKDKTVETIVGQVVDKSTGGTLTKTAKDVVASAASEVIEELIDQY